MAQRLVHASQCGPDKPDRRRNRDANGPPSAVEPCLRTPVSEKIHALVVLETDEPINSACFLQGSHHSSAAFLFPPAGFGRRQVFTCTVTASPASTSRRPNRCPHPSSRARIRCHVSEVDIELAARRWRRPALFSAMMRPAAPLHNPWGAAGGVCALWHERTSARRMEFEADQGVARRGDVPQIHAIKRNGPGPSADKAARIPDGTRGPNTIYYPQLPEGGRRT